MDKAGFSVEELTASRLFLGEANGREGTELIATADELNSLVGGGPVCSSKRGFDRLNPDTMGVPSYDAVTQTFSLAVKAGESLFRFWSNGLYFEKTTTQSIIWPDVSGVYYFYFDDTGTLQYVIDTAMSESIFLPNAICGLVCWNATTQKIIVQAVDEQHGILMLPSTHLNMHLCDHAKYAHGGAITGLVDGGDTYTGIASLLSMDEDITISTIASTSHVFLYRSGASADNEWTETVASLRVGYKVGEESNISWNEEVGGAWQLTESNTSTDYIIHYFLWTNDAVNPIKKIVGQQAYASRSVARAALYTELGQIESGGLPSTEYHFLYAYIVYRTGTVEDDGDGHAYIDLRGVKLAGLS